jgi:hypothetical protein
MMLVISRLILLALVLVFFERPVSAYLDPGTGSMLLQVALGGAAAVGVIVKMYWHRVRRFLGLRSGDDQR